MRVLPLLAGRAVQMYFLGLRQLILLAGLEFRIEQHPLPALLEARPVLGGPAVVHRGQPPLERRAAAAARARAADLADGVEDVQPGPAVGVGTNVAIQRHRDCLRTQSACYVPQPTCASWACRTGSSASSPSRLPSRRLFASAFHWSTLRAISYSCSARWRFSAPTVARRSGLSSSSAIAPTSSPRTTGRPHHQAVTSRLLLLSSP